MRGAFLRYDLFLTPAFVGPRGGVVRDFRGGREADGDGVDGVAVANVAGWKSNVDATG